MQKRILIADIDSDLLTRLEVLFEDKGYYTTTAWGGREMLRELQSKQFDLILLSDYLPDIESEELWRSLRRLAGSAFVALLETSDPVEKMAGHYLRAGGRCVLLKASPYKIVEAVCGCLGSGESHQLDWTNAARVAKMNP
ncbi:MAG: response regulator, partial [Terriglobia bacterium]